MRKEKMTMKKYKLRYEGKGNISYAESDAAADRRDIRKEPIDEFGKKLEEMVRQLTEEFPNKSVSIEVKAW